MHLNLSCEKPQEMAGSVSVAEPELTLWGILGESSKRGRNSTFESFSRKHISVWHFVLAYIPTKAAIHFLDDMCPPATGTRRSLHLGLLCSGHFMLMCIPGQFRERSPPSSKDRKENGNKVLIWAELVVYAHEVCTKTSSSSSPNPEVTKNDEISLK